MERPNYLPIVKTGAVSIVFAKTRPVVSAAVVSRVLQYLGNDVENVPIFDQMIDVGCGTGFSTVEFAPHFQRVTAIDTSESQLHEARFEYSRVTNVQFSVGSSDHLPVEASSTDLVTAIQAAHWFDPSKFFSECDRVLRPKGVVALLGYGLLKIDHENEEKCTELNSSVQNIYDVIANSQCWDKRRRIVDDQYIDIELPYSDKLIIRDNPELYLENELSVQEFVDYVSTWSGYRTYKEKFETSENEDEDILNQLKLQITEILGKDDNSIRVNFPWFICMSRKT